MKVITEAILRDELRALKPETYVIPEGKILSPAGREYLQQLKIKIITQKELKNSKKESKEVSEAVKESDSKPKQSPENLDMMKKPKYKDYESGAFYYDKPEHMTQLYGNMLVTKNHERIYFRGRLDALEAEFVLKQTVLKEDGASQGLIDDLEDILNSLREMMRCDVLNLPYRRDYMIGLNHAELREHSHNPQKFYNIEQMILPSYTLGKTYAIINFLRTKVRETEVAAVTAFSKGVKCERPDIVEELNRMSSAMHIIMCKHMAGEYGKD
ncbi:ethanolamine utilization cobalamin adenosyltransferase [Acetitomaculum ruminis DSM 5522]|uniref:Ethanolamine utilization cobalamin adenosyltransferase n=1 Tax=Acetitomaculum ruminis DSM 5522 TaxID=1120918 RepID=A0A1I0ZTQ8_9FIRM|nr:ATP-binding protein [Acetitomaculum ruminis]SFB28911.1 ethanolamine utilization cobalamin adenosyltransferase [Acetitomaculum ruminis DSM 5522]